MIKKIIFSIIPFIILFCCLSYGFNLITNTTGLTFLEYRQIGSTEIIYFNTQKYISSIQTFHIDEKIENIANLFTDFIEDFKQIGTIWKNGYHFGDLTKTIINGFITLINFIIFILNTIIYILQLILYIAIKVLNLIGLNIQSIQWINTILTTKGITLIPIIN